MIVNDRELSEVTRSNGQNRSAGFIGNHSTAITKLFRTVGSFERVVIESYYLENKDPEDAAAQLAITRNHYGVLAHRARQKLKRCLESLGFDSANAVLSL